MHGCQAAAGIQQLLAFGQAATQTRASTVSTSSPENRDLPGRSGAGVECCEEDEGERPMQAQNQRNLAEQHAR
jgi:hypothetical protein